MGTLKRVLSGALGEDLLDVEFSTAQVEDSDEHVHFGQLRLRISVTRLCCARFLFRRYR